jgi:hypothetical protein
VQVDLLLELDRAECRDGVERPVEGAGEHRHCALHARTWITGENIEVSGGFELSATAAPFGGSRIAPAVDGT